MPRTVDFTEELTEDLCSALNYITKWNSPGVADGLRKENETLAEFYERFGKGSEVPSPPEVPEFCNYLMNWFWRLSKRRQPSQGGISPITFADVGWFKELLGVPITPAEVGILLDMDDAYRKGLAENRQKPKAADKPEGR